MTNNKIQALLINHLLKYGQIEILLPDNMVLEIGMTQLDEVGNLKVNPEYCWLIAKQKDRYATMDSFNLGICFQNDGKSILLEDDFTDSDENYVKQLNVV